MSDVEQARAVAVMLESGDDLGSIASGLAALVRDAPTLVPLDLVRARLDDPAPTLRVVLRRTLGALRNPEDALRILARVDASDASDHVAWLGPLPGSERLVPLVKPEALVELLCRRRCAGLSSRDFVFSTLARESPLVVEQLTEPEQARAWFTRSRVHFHQFADEIDTLARFGTDGETIVRDVAPTKREHFRGRREVFEILAAEAARDAEYRLEHETLAIVLRCWPDHVYAAAQLAWIDRAGGTPIVPERITWLRGLGVIDDAFLAELAMPAPPTPLPTAAALDAHIVRVQLACRGRGGLA